MSYPLPYESPLPVPPNSRRGGLIALGVIMIVLGSVAGCLSLMMPLVLLVPRPAGTPAPNALSILMGLGFYVPAAVALIWTGIASCRCRRWVRPIVLAVAWPSLAGGILGVLAIGVTLPTSMPPPTPPGQAPIPPEVWTAIMAGALVFYAILGIALPAAFIWFYRGPHVRATLEHYDPYPAWTDRCPLPVLGLSLWMAIGALFLLLTFAMLCVPFFGVYLTGAAAALATFATVGLLAFGAWSAYRLRPVGWWIALALAIVLPASFALTAARLGILEFYRLSGTDQQTVLHLQQNPAMLQFAAFMPLVSALLVLAYLLYIRRHFYAPAPAPQPQQNAP